jgi:plastocyanin
MRFRTSALAAAVLSAAACGGGDSGPAGGPGPGGGINEPSGTPVQAANVSVENNYFSPNSVLVRTGGTVTWTWNGSGHSVTSDGSPGFSPNAPVSNAPHTLGPVTFPDPGSYQYYCQVHGSPGYGDQGMKGAVTVR